MTQITDKETNITIKEETFSKLMPFVTNRFELVSSAEKIKIVQNLLHSLAFDNKLPISGSDIKNWDYNAYISEKEGFAINKDDFKTTPSLANFYKNYEVLDTVLHEFYHRYTTYYKDKQTDEFKLNLDGYFNPSDLIYYTQPTEIGARQFSIRMLEKLNEYFKDKELTNFIEYQKLKFKEENKNEYKGIRKEGYKNVNTLYEFKARENIIDKANLQKYVKVTENNLNYFFSMYQDTLSIAVEEYNSNKNESLFLCATCKDNILYIDNFYGPESNLKDYAKKFSYLENKLEQIAKYYEKQTGNVITKLEISPFFQGLKRNERNKIVSNFLLNKNDVNKISHLNNQDFNIQINVKNYDLENKISNNENNIKFSSILNRLEDAKTLNEESIDYLKNKLINEFNFDKNITNEETRKIFKYFAFKTNNITDRLDFKKLKDSIDNYFVLKNSNKLDEVIAENIITDEKEFETFLTKSKNNINHNTR